LKDIPQTKKGRNPKITIEEVMKMKKGKNQNKEENS